jgi:hypothetical protein
MMMMMMEEEEDEPCRLNRPTVPFRTLPMKPEIVQ